MAYSELIKNFDRIRDYMRQFYVYGFRSRTEYDGKSPRSYDNERLRLESWLGGYMGFRRTPDGKNVFLSVDSRAIPRNPLYSAFRAKSFTAGDAAFHFYILDLLRDGSYTAQQIVDLFSQRYLCHFDSGWEPDLSTVRKKLKEYVALGLLRSGKRGRELVFSRNDSPIALDAWADTLAFFSEADPLGVVGAFLLPKGEVSLVRCSSGDKLQSAISVSAKASILLNGSFFRKNTFATFFPRFSLGAVITYRHIGGIHMMNTLERKELQL